ncbi:MAG: membrane protein insertase YidC [Silvanigrellales bacterium]|nr:membrane protein insertase YidC [Silvanigrellales bacterium]
MNKNTVAFVASLIALFAGYFYLNYYFANKEKAQTVAPTASVTSEVAGATAGTGTAALVATAAAVPTAVNAGVPSAGESAPVAAVVAAVPTPLPPLAVANANDLVVDLPASRVRFSEKGGCITSALLTNYRQTAKGEALAEVFDGFANCKAFGLRFGNQDLREAPIGVTRTGEKSLRIVQRAEGVEIVRDWSFQDKNYGALLRIEVINSSNAAVNSALGIEVGATSEHVGSGGMFSGHPIEYRNVSFYSDEKVNREHLVFEKAPTNEEVFRKNGFLPGWVASENISFLSALLPRGRDVYDLSLLRTGYNIQKTAGSEDVRTVYDGWLDTALAIPAGQSKVYEYDVYIGPKQRDVLTAFGTAKLEESIDFGFFRIVALPMYHALAWLHKHLGNWGLAIVALTLAIKILFYPLMVKAYIAGKKMQKIQPKMTELRETYKDDKAQQQKEIMALMSQQGVNPASGCLPILPQIPVFFGLNAVLTHTFELRHAPFYGWIQDLSTRDPYFISPVLMAGLMYLQQRMTPMPSMEPAQQRMMQILPLVFAVFMLSYPSGLVVYIVTNSVVSLIQQKYMMHKYRDL